MARDLKFNVIEANGKKQLKVKKKSVMSSIIILYHLEIQFGILISGKILSAIRDNPLGLSAGDWLRSRTSTAFQQHLAALPAWTKTTGSFSSKSFTYTNAGTSVEEKIVEIQQKIIQVCNEHLFENIMIFYFKIILSEN